MNNNIAVFGAVKGPNGLLGNMAPTPITYKGQEWRTSEALFQAMRFNDVEIRETIRAKTSPMSAKWAAKAAMKARPDAMIVTPQSEADIANMRWILINKFNANKAARTQLMATGDAIIVEDTTKQNGKSSGFWGAKLQADGTWIGGNMMGTLLMELRAKYQAKYQAIRDARAAAKQD